MVGPDFDLGQGLVRRLLIRTRVAGTAQVHQRPSARMMTSFLDGVTSTWADGVLGMTVVRVTRPYDLDVECHDITTMALSFMLLKCTAVSGRGNLSVTIMSASFTASTILLRIPSIAACRADRIDLGTITAAALQIGGGPYTAIAATTYLTGISHRWSGRIASNRDYSRI